jgi:hypothetical protein
MEYRPKFSNVKELYDEVADELKEAVELEALHVDHAVSRFAQYLDEYVQAILDGTTNKIVYMLTPGDNPDEILLTAWNEDFDNHEGHRIDFWKLMDELKDLVKGWDDHGNERQKAIIIRLRNLADEIEAIDSSDS